MRVQNEDACLLDTFILKLFPDVIRTRLGETLPSTRSGKNIVAYSLDPFTLKLFPGIMHNEERKLSKTSENEVLQICDFVFKIKLNFFDFFNFFLFIF